MFLPVRPARSEADRRPGRGRVETIARNGERYRRSVGPESSERGLTDSASVVSGSAHPSFGSSWPSEDVFEASNPAGPNA